LQSAANNNQCSASLTWDALNRVDRTGGAPYVDIDSFAIRFESEPEIQQYVDRYDEHGIVLKTAHNMPDVTQFKEPESPVSDIAKKAVRKKHRD
jgi:hypothetical protein